MFFVPPWTVVLFRKKNTTATTAFETNCIFSKKLKKIVRSRLNGTKTAPENAFSQNRFKFVGKNE